MNELILKKILYKCNNSTIQNIEKNIENHCV